MSAVPGELVDITTVFASAGVAALGGVFASPTTSIGTLVYKNQGYYVAGSVFEEWVTSGAPSTTPPSGHTLTDISYVVLQI